MPFRLAHSLAINTSFDSSSCEDNHHYHCRQIILKILEKILPKDFFEVKETLELTRAHQKKALLGLLPLINCSETQSFPGHLSFFALSKYRSNAFTFFLEMISRWLIPGKRLNVLLVYATDFQLPDLSDEIYSICEVMIRVDSEVDFKEIQRRFTIVGTEITLGIQSAFYAQRILEVKSVSSDEKTGLIQSFMAFLMKRFPRIYDNGIFTEMQHVLVVCRDDFKDARRARHLSRIISIHYLFRKSLVEAVKRSPQKRHLSLKIFRAFIQSEPERRRVLALVIGINLFRDQEAFGEKHVLRAIQHYIPNAQSVEQSFFINKMGSENICTLYLEIEKKDGSDFNSFEIKKLRRELPTDLKNRIEHKLHPVFMPCNEEEIMRNILILSNQIRYLRDLPQVFILFDEQGYSYLSFTVILVRLMKPGMLPIPELFRKDQTFLDYVHDRTKIVGSLRKKYAKEASVFRVRLPKDTFLRADHSIDLYKARQSIVIEMTRLIGEFRDYNGGMISKQHEQLSQIRRLLGNPKDYNELLLENFFYSLAPLVRSLMDPVAFKTLFVMLQKGLQEYREGYYINYEVESYNTFVLIISEDAQLQDLLQKDIQPLHIPSAELAAASAKANGHFCIGYICCAKEPQKKELFIEAVHNCLKNVEPVKAR